MNCWILLAASMVSCPWGRPAIQSHCYSTPVYYSQCYSAPVYTLPSQPMVVYRSPISPPVAAQVQEVVTENAVLEEVVAAGDEATEGALGIEEASLEEDELVTEPAAFQSAYGLTLSEMALDWGVAVIGPGTLYPQDYRVVSGGGGFFGGPGGNRPQAAGLPLPPCNCPEPPLTPGPGGEPPIITPPGSGGEPVPEPMSVMIWAMALGGLWFYHRRGKRVRLQPIAVSERNG